MFRFYGLFFLGQICKQKQTLAVTQGRSDGDLCFVSDLAQLRILFHFPVQRRAAHAEQFGRLGDVAFGLLQGTGDDFRFMHGFVGRRDQCVGSCC